LIVESMISTSPAWNASTTPPLLALPLTRVSPRRVRLQPFSSLKSPVDLWPSSVAPSPLLATVTLMLELQLIWLLSLRCEPGARKTETLIAVPSIRERSSASLAAATKSGISGGSGASGGRGGEGGGGGAGGGGEGGQGGEGGNGGKGVESGGGGGEGGRIAQQI